MRPLTSTLPTIQSHPKHDSNQYMAIPVYPFSENMPTVDRWIHQKSSQFHTPDTATTPERDQFSPTRLSPTEEISFFLH